MTKTIIGNIFKQLQEKRGWLVGQFMPEPFKDKDVEIFYKTFPVGKPDDPLHLHPVGKEYLIVLQGSAKFRVGDEILEIKKGDYLTVTGGTPDQLIEIIEEMVLMGVRCPSIPDNKVFVKE